jgi:hypothetical protein
MVEKQHMKRPAYLFTGVLLANGLVACLVLIRPLEMYHDSLHYRDVLWRSLH